MKYIVTVTAEITIENLEIECDAFNEQEMARIASHQWLSSIRGGKSEGVSIDDADIITWEKV